MPKTVSEETRRKISETLKGRPGHPMSEEVRRKISETMKGHPVTDKLRQRASETHKGKTVSEETRQKQATAHYKPVRATNKHTGQVFTFTSRREAEETLGIQMNRVSYIIKYQNGNSKEWFFENI